MDIFVQLLINGLIAGAIYSLVACGFSLIYSTNKFIHFAHGGVIIVSSYIFYTLFSILHLEFYLSCILAILLAGLVGYLINQFIYKPFRKRKASNSILLIASFGVLIFLESMLLIIFGANVQTIDYIPNAQGLSVLGAIITPLQIVIIISSIILLIFFYFFMKKTRIGKAMRAVSDNPDVAEIVGISASKIYAWTFTIGSMVAGIAAILISLEQNIEPSMGSSLMIKGFTAAVIGGLGSVPGAIFGAFLLGFAENFGIWYLPSGYKDAIAFVLLFLFLLFRPNGILGLKYNNQK